MLNSAQEIAELANSLGTINGLQRVNFEIDLLNARLAEKNLPFSRQELAKMSAALASLSSAIVEISRTARAMLAEAGITFNHVG
jgi:hypothetical protein